MLQEVNGNIESLKTDFPLINAVLRGKQSGKIFTSDSVLFVLHKSGFSFLQVSSGFNDYKCVIDSLLNLKEIPTYLHFYSPPQELIEECSKSSFLNIKVRKRVHFKFERGDFLEENDSIPQGYCLHKISEHNFESLSVFNLNIADKFWSSKEDFLVNGFGFFVSNRSGEPASICYAACLANQEAEIDIATLQHHQKKGLAKAVARRFTQYCINEAIAPNWDCFTSNVGSLSLAEKLGFSKALNYNFLSVFNTSRTT